MPLPGDVLDELRAVGIHMTRRDVGRNFKLLCPRCNGGNDREKALSVLLDADGGAVWECKRGSCGWKGNVPGRSAAQGKASFTPRPKAYVRPPAPVAPIKTDPLYEFFGARGISRETVDAFGCFLTKRAFPQLDWKEAGAIAFPYIWKGEYVNAKFRSREKHFIQEKGAEPTLFNIDRIDLDRVVFCEGESDVMAVFEAGEPSAVSLANGAPAKLKEEVDPNDLRYLPLHTHAEQLAQVKSFVLAGDMDGPGRNHCEEIARRLGKEKCRLVKWPEDCKDANETLQKHGRQAVLACLDHAAPYPISGLWNLGVDDIAVLDSPTWSHTVSTGSRVLDALFRIPVQGRLFVITGVPNAGKSTFLNWLVTQQARLHGRKLAIFSPESEPWQLHGSQLAEVYSGKPWRVMSPDEKIDAVTFVGHHFTHIAQPREDQLPSMEWLLDQVRFCVLRDGINGVVIDPWNEIEHARPNGQSMTEYANLALPRLKRFCAVYGINVFLVAHPRKLQSDEIPTGYAIADTAAFANKADFGISVYRPDPNIPARIGILTWKIRFKSHGSKGACWMMWDRASDRFHDCDEQPDNWPQPVPA